MKNERLVNIYNIVTIVGIFFFVLGFILTYFYSYKYSQYNFKFSAYNFTIPNEKQNIVVSFVGRNSSAVIPLTMLIFSFIGSLLFVYCQFKLLKLKTDINLIALKISETAKLEKRWNYILIFVLSIFALLMISVGIYYFIDKNTISFQSPYGDIKNLVNNKYYFKLNTGPIWPLLIGVNFSFVPIFSLIFYVVYKINYSKK